MAGTTGIFHQTFKNKIHLTLIYYQTDTCVPNSLSGTSFGFRFNDFSALEKLVNEKDIGVIKMEVQRSDPPENNFLHNVRKLASKKNIILIFDECTSGFRETNTGLDKKYNIEPDIAIYGKALEMDMQLLPL